MKFKLRLKNIPKYASFFSECFFKDTNMDIYRVAPSGFIIKITKYGKEHEQLLASNFVALAKNKQNA